MSSQKLLDMIENLTPEMQQAITNIVNFLYHQTKLPENLSIYDLQKPRKGIADAGFALGDEFDNFSTKELPEVVKEDMAIFEEGGEEADEKLLEGHPIFKMPKPEDNPSTQLLFDFAKCAKLDLKVWNPQERLKKLPYARVKKEEIMQLEKDNPAVFSALIRKYNVKETNKVKYYKLALYVLDMYK